MYAKLLPNGALITAPNKVRTQDSLIYNPPVYILRERGYKLVQYTNMPNDAPDGHFYEPDWEETDDAILQTWTLMEEDADVEIPDDEVFAIIMGVES